jgi:hypothetical protein
MQGFRMNSKIVIVLVVQFTLVCAPPSRQAAALERDQDSVQQCSLNRKPSEECLNHQDISRVKENRQVLLRHQGRIRSMPSQSDLLQDLLTGEVIRHESIQLTEAAVPSQRNSYKIKGQETDLLEELLVTTSIPRR